MGKIQKEVNQLVTLCQTKSRVSYIAQSLLEPEMSSWERNTRLYYVLFIHAFLDCLLQSFKKQ